MIRVTEQSPRDLSGDGDPQVGLPNSPVPHDALWRFARFERDTRYYELRLQQDLFGWVVVKVWGRKSSRLGQMRTTPCSSFLEASRLWDAGVRTRQRKGYVPADMDAKHERE